jgi:membrane-associated phospholipid phosphatase
VREERTRRPITVLVAIAALALIVFLVLAAYVLSRHGNITLDVRIENLVSTHRTGWLVATMKAVTWLGASVVLIPVVLAVATWFSLRWGDNRSAAELVATLAGAILLYDIGKAVVHRARPPAIYHVGYSFSGASFPSGHTTVAIATWGMFAFLLASRASPRTRKGLVVGAVVLTVAIGASRIYIGAHWPTDVIGGYALGGAWLASLVVLDLWMRRPAKDRKPKPAAPGSGADGPT